MSIGCRFVSDLMDADWMLQAFVFKEKIPNCFDEEVDCPRIQNIDKKGAHQKQYQKSLGGWPVTRSDSIHIGNRQVMPNCLRLAQVTARLKGEKHGQDRSTRFPASNNPAGQPTPANIF